MARGLVTTTLNLVDAHLDDFVFNSYSSLSSALLPTIKLLFILFWVIYGISILKGLVEFHIKDFLNNLFRLTLIFVFLTNWNIFNTFVYEFFTDTPHYLGSLMLASSPSATNVNMALDNMLNEAIYAAQTMIYDSPMSDVGTKLTGFFFLAVFLVLIAYAAYLVILSKVAISLLLGLSPIFFIMLVFKKTTGLFEGWLRQVINFALIPVLTYGLLSLVLAITDADLTVIIDFNKANSMLPTASIFPMLFIVIISIVLFLQVEGIASGIAGGIQISGMAQSVARSAGMARVFAAKKVGKAATRLKGENSVRN